MLYRRSRARALTPPLFSRFFARLPFDQRALTSLDVSEYTTGDKARVRNIQIMKEEWVELAGKVDCLHDKEPR